jgi:hypothetical protein
MSSANRLIDEGIAPPPGAPLLGNVAYMPPGFEGFYKEPFSYNVLFNPIAAAAVVIQQTQIQNDSYFVCTEQCATIWDSATQNTTNIQPNLASMLVRIADTSSGKYKMDQTTPLANLFGTAQQPFVWLYRASIYMPGGQIQVELTNQMAASQTVRLTFHGFKVYKVPDNMMQM